MSFDRLDLRPGLAVYSRDDHYLGRIREVVPGRPPPWSERVHSAAQQSSVGDGEGRGPLPTAALGNTGPARQSAAAGYGVRRACELPVGAGTMVVGRWWGLVGRRRLALADILLLSMERVTIRQRHAELEAGANMSVAWKMRRATRRAAGWPCRQHQEGE